MTIEAAGRSGAPDGRVMVTPGRGICPVDRPLSRALERGQGAAAPADHWGVASDAPTPVLWLGLLEGPSGYADEARAFLRALEAAGHEPAARELLRDGSDARLSSSERALLRRQLERNAPDGSVAVHHYAPAWARETPEIGGVANVARTMFETDRVPVSWLPQLVRRDEVWVPSEHGREAFERGGIPSERLRVVPGTLDFDLYAPGAEPLKLDVPEGHLVFLSNFAFSERKAWRELLAAWARAFDPRDPVCLVLKTSARRARARCGRASRPSSPPPRARRAAPPPPPRGGGPPPPAPPP